MIDDNEPEVIVGSSASVSIGEELRQARETKKLTINEVAALLKLPIETVINLEADNWEQLPGRIYARGYLVNYARFLGLPEEAVLSTFNIEYKSTEIEKIGSQQNNNKTAFPWLPVIMIVIVLVITWFAYQQWQASETEATDGSAAVSQLQGIERVNKQNTMDTLSISVVEPIISSGEEA